MDHYKNICETKSSLLWAPHVPTGKDSAAYSDLLEDFFGCRGPSVLILHSSNSQLTVLNTIQTMHVKVSVRWEMFKQHHWYLWPWQEIGTRVEPWIPWPTGQGRREASRGLGWQRLTSGGGALMSPFRMISLYVTCKYKVYIPRSDFGCHVFNGCV